MRDITDHLSYLKLPVIRENYETIGKRVASKQWGHIQYLSELVEQELNLRRDRCKRLPMKTAF